MQLRVFSRFLLGAAALCVAVGAWARGGEGRDTIPSGYYGYQPSPDAYETQGYYGARNDGMPASVRRIQRETGGQVLKAQPYERDGREMYRVKVLTPQGRIKVYEEDSASRDARANPPQLYPRGVPSAAPPAPAPVPQRREPVYPHAPPPAYPSPYPSPRNHPHSG